MEPVDSGQPVSVVNDPPPPYPSHSRRSRRSGRRTIRLSPSTQHSSADSGYDPLLSPDTDEVEPTETTPFLPPSRVRRRSISHGSVFSSSSTAPSLAQTLVSLFNTEDDDSDCDIDGRYLEERHLIPVVAHGTDDHHIESSQQADPGSQRHRDRGGILSARAWRRYFRPLFRKAYWMPLFHLAVLNFPYALAAWIFLFVFTVTGTTLLVVLPLGSVLCFFNALGARIFSRGELIIQTKFHTISFPPPHPPRPIFTRLREPTAAEIESGHATPGHHLPENSFYKNTYAMFTDPLTYQALFYFLVVKPAITIILSLALIVFALPSLVLFISAPMALRAVRRLGTWQANVAVEGLYFAVQ